MKSPLWSAGKPGNIIRHIVLCAFLGAAMLVLQLALAGLPNIEIVTLLCTLYGLVFGWMALPAVYVFVLLEGLIFGFGIWWFSYLYIWLIPLLGGLLFRRRPALARPWSLAIFAGGFGLFFGALCALPYLITGGPSMAFSWWVSGIPFDLIHCAGNFAAALLLSSPLIRVLEYIKKKMLV